MVLEDATASPAGDSFTEDGARSDFGSYDTYAGDDAASGIPHLNLDVTKLPRPFGLTGFRYMNEKETRMLADHLAKLSQAINRSLTQAEADSLAYHFATRARKESYGPFVSALVVLPAFLSGREDFRLPFFKPKTKEWFNPDVLGPFRGINARRGWHGIRALAYAATGGMLTIAVWSSYVNTVSAVNTIRDPNLAQLNDDIKARSDQIRSGLPAQIDRGQSAPITTAEGQMDSQIKKVRERAAALKQRSQERRDRAGKNIDDYSPVASGWEQDNSSSTDTGMLTDEQTRSLERRQQSDQRSSPARDQSSTFEMDSVTSQPDSFDDASPQAAPPAQNKYPKGSSWERIRQEAAQGRQQGSQDRGMGRTAGWGGVQREQQREQRQGSTLGDSFTFSSSDEERQLAKTEAQKDFDDRVERERRGGDFSQGR